MALREKVIAERILKLYEEINKILERKLCKVVSVYFGCGEEISPPPPPV